MKLKFLLLIALLASIATFSQDFGTIASGIKIQNTIYNINSNSAINAINPNITAQNFEGLNLGTFGQNSNCALITGAEIKTFKNASSNVCSAVLNWRVYTTGAPSGIYNAISLTTISDCNLGTNTYLDGLGPCAAGNQKWKDYSLTTNFATGLSAGSYVLETYFSFTGSNVNTNTCETTKILDNAGLFYKANFTIANPTVMLASALPASVCEGSNLTLSATVSGGVAPYNYAWTGPNGFNSALASPVIVANLLTTGGIYSVIVTDACGVSTLSVNTNIVNVMPRAIPTFETLLLTYCRKVQPPVPPVLPILPVPLLIPPVQLPNTSTEGIDGAWSLNGLINDNPTANPLFVETDPLPNGSLAPLLSTTRYYFYPNASECGSPIFVDIVIRRNTLPTFNFPLNYCIGDVVANLPLNSSNSVGGTWSNVLGAPVTKIDTTVAGTFQYNFSPNPGLCALQRAYIVTITPKKVPTFTLPTSLCVGGTVPVLLNNSEDSPPISGTWTPAIVSNTTTQTYTFNAVGVCVGNKQITITVNQVITPTFDPIADICKNRVATALPTQSTNVPPILGNWSGSINTSVSGLQTFTFTPTSNLCATTATISVNIKEPLEPIFAPIATICKGTATAETPVLPTSSNNVPPITGTWFPLGPINTATAGTFTYTFTPTAGQCAIPKDIVITIKNIFPTIISPLADICIGTTPSPALPQPTNVPTVTGTWNPSSIDTSVAGTFTYTFTPIGAACADVQTIQVKIVNPIIPSFAPFSQICQFGVAPVLPSQSTNVPPIFGEWTPAINTSIIGITEYTFAPFAGQCAKDLKVNITVKPNIIPTFNIITAVCFSTTPPELPLSSTNTPPITGTWFPATINTSVLGSSDYIFTPTDGQCAIITTMAVNVVTSGIVPLFSQISSICKGTIAPSLPQSSNNSVPIFGSWFPATINTSQVGSSNYTFTPGAEFCAIPIIIQITIDEPIVTTFDPITNTSICKNGIVPVLPTISTNGFNGTWTPTAIVSNTLIGTTVYTFNPASGICATKPTVSINVYDPTDEPTFDSVSLSICSGKATPILPLISTNGFTGTWTPNVVNVMQTGTYKFEPTTGLCAKDKIITITYVPEIQAEIKSECVNANYILFLTAVGNAFNANNTFVWKDETGTVIQGENSATLDVSTYMGSSTQVKSFPLNYSVEIKTLEGCITTKTFTIESAYCNIQNGISPNGDNKNDYFDLSNFDINQFSIFNRYGMKVYTKIDYKTEWIGQTDSGETLPDGTYFYNIEFGNNEIKTGWVYINK